MKSLKKTSGKRNETQSKVNHRFNIQTLTTEMELLKKREHQLAERLISEQPLVNELRKNPRFIKDADKVCLANLANLVDDVYNNFTSRLVNRFPNLTEVDIQYCILIKLRFTVAQIAILSAISPTSVYQQKSRMKKRILRIEPDVFSHRETLDVWLYGSINYKKRQLRSPSRISWLSFFLLFYQQASAGHQNSLVKWNLICLKSI